MSLARLDTDPATALTEDEARSITTRIRQCVEIALVEIKKAYDGRAWSVLGYESWTTYCTAEFGEHIRLPRDERRAAVGELRQAGMSVRAIAAATGSSKNTVSSDLSQIGTPAPTYVEQLGSRPSGSDPSSPRSAPRVCPVIGLDGKKYPKTKATVRRPPQEAEQPEACINDGIDVPPGYGLGFVWEVNQRLAEGLRLMPLLGTDAHELIHRDLVETDRIIGEIRSCLIRE